MNIIIHRGSKQIGGNCIEISSGSSRIILDIGQELPDIDSEAHQKISVLPKVEGLYRGDKKIIDAVLISHGHGDHVGLIQSVNPEIPVYMGEKAFKIFDVTSKFTGGQTIINPLNYLASSKKIKIGGFEITPYLVDHSGFDAYAFIIKANNKCIVYTGDFRDHGRKKKATDYFLKNIPRNINGLLIEGTMMSRVYEKIKTEDDIEEESYKFMKVKSGPVFVLQSSTNIDRLVGMYRAAKRSGRIFVMDIFTAHIVSQLNKSIPNPDNFGNIKVFYPRYLTKRMFEEPGGPALMRHFSKYKITKEELSEKNNYCMLIRESMLSDLKHIRNLNEAGFIYSMWDGYKRVGRTEEMLDYIKLKGMTMIALHTSGHASVECIQRVIESSQLQKIIPIHTEKPELFDKQFKKVHITKDGDHILF